MKQTAVEWLENEFQEICKDFGGLHSDFIERFNQAKAMEKEQIKNSYHSGTIDGFNFRTTSISPNPEQYYNENFKSE